MDIQYYVWMLAILLISCLFVINFVWELNQWYYNLKLRNKQYPLPLGDLGWPLIGNTLNFIKDFSSGRPDSFIDNLVIRYGRIGIYKTHLFGNPSIIICEGEMCKRVLTDDETFKIGYPKSLVEVIKCKPFWSFSRKEHMRFKRLISPLTVGHNTLEMYLTRIEDIIVKSLDELSSMSHPIEFLKEIKIISFKIIIEIFMGSYNRHIVTKIGNSFTQIQTALFCLPINLPGFDFHRGLKAREKLVKIVQPIIEERRLAIKNGDKKEILVDILLDAKDDDDGWIPEDEDIIEMLIGIVLAGHETTALGMMWSIIYLTQNPQILNKAKEEQEKIIKTRSPTQKQLSFEEIKKMVYLSQIINEMLRIVSMNFALFREATKDVNINGYIIPKGWKVLTWLRAIHMDPTYYPNPNEFNPSRWDGDNAKVGSFLPFGAGIMHCPGNNLAKIEISVFLHYFILNYKLERVNPNCPINSLPSSKPIDNCLAKVIKLTSA